MKAIADEYLIVVGSPSNMFNGYLFKDADGTTSLLLRRRRSRQLPWHWGSDITVTFPPGVFTPDGKAKLWGCSLGDSGNPPSFAKVLAPHANKTIASEGLISYEGILDTLNKLPEPSDLAAFPFKEIVP